MPRRANSETRRFHNEDLVLQVTSSVDRGTWDESKYEAFIDELCGHREYQKQAIQTALRYFLSGEYNNLKVLADKNFAENEKLSEKYGSKDGMGRNLQFPNKLAASLDLATATGKSYVMYGIAAIMLAEGAVDRVLMLCPSTTIESELMKKFTELAGNANLRDLLPEEAVTRSPGVIDASESIVSGCICVENYHAVLSHVRSSVRDSLKGKGERTLVLNDEAHHVVNDTNGVVSRWKEFLTDSEFGFRYIIGLSGTCYIGSDYFSDVIYRYSLRQAMEQGFVKKVQYVAEMPHANRNADEKLQLILNRHNEIRKKVAQHGLLPLTIVVTKDISGCENVAEEFKNFLIEYTGQTREKVNEQVLVVHSNSPDLAKLRSVDSKYSKIEWIFSVSMLNEGWDVKRVFQIVPHEKRAFESKLLIAQVLGRGLRLPEGWNGEQPEVIIFNHDNWAHDIKHLVDEVMETEKRIPTFPIDSSKFNFELINIHYDPTPRTQTFEMDAKYKLFAKGYIDLSTDLSEEEIKIEFEEAGSGRRSEWKTKIKHKTYAPREVAEVMHQRFDDLEEESDRRYYANKYPADLLERIIIKSLERTGNRAITENIRQKFLQSLGTLQRKASTVVRYDFEPRDYIAINTHERSQESATASELKDTKTLFFTPKTLDTLGEEYQEFYSEATEAASGYRCYPVTNAYDFKSPLNAVIADHDNERKFIKELISVDNLFSFDSWIKSTSMGFYEIDYYWKKGEHPKRGKFNPDFFIKTGNLILVVEIKDDNEVRDPSPENKKKFEYAVAHFNRINKYLEEKNTVLRYKFNFLTPTDFSSYFQSIKTGDIETFSSELDVKLRE